MNAFLAGNLTLDMQFDSTGENYLPWALEPVSTNMMSTGLKACSDIRDSAWRTKIFSPWEEEDLSLEELQGAFDETFPSEPWMCRNKTFLRAIEDLANNITISFLSSAELINTNTTRRNITTSDKKRNEYVYQPLYLLLSYGLALLFTSLAASLGFYSLWLNGVSHSMSFSAIVATTRNPELDLLTHGSSLGALPPKADFEDAKLRFGPLLNNTKGASDEGPRDERQNSSVPHLAFGVPERVGNVEKGAAYV